MKLRLNRSELGTCFVLIVLGMTGAACGGDDGQGSDGGGSNEVAVADASAPSGGLVGQWIRLAGAATDPDGDELTFAWTQTSGPLGVLADSEAASARFLPRSVGTFTFSLVANDGSENSPPATVSVDVFDLDGGEEFSLSLEPDGTLSSWGANGDGQLGAPGTPSRSVPDPVCDSGEIDCETNPFAGVVAIAAGGDHSVALGMDGRVWAWGANDSNQLGDGTTNPATSPQPVCNVGASNCAADPLDDVVHIVAGTGFSAALRSDGSVVAWGSNANGELGDGSTTQRATPVKVCAPGETAPCQAFLSDVVVLAAGGSHSLAITESGELYGWGNNEAGQVGVGDTSTAEVAIPRRVCASGMTSPCSSFFVGAVSIDAWAEHSLVSDESGVLWAFGSNAENELGAASTDTCANLQTCNSSPKPVCMAAETSCTTPLDGVSSFGAGRYFSIALRSDGSLLAWGDNRHGQLGNDSTDPSETPTAVCNVSASAPCENSPAALVEAATAGSFQTFALRSDGSVLVWGSNTSGQVGNASPGTDALTPLILSL